MENPTQQPLIFHAPGVGTPPLEMMNFDDELVNITNSINLHSHSRPVDKGLLTILKANYDRQA